MPAIGVRVGALREGDGQGTPKPGPGGYVRGVGPVAELSEFLTTRRANVTPEQAGLPSYGRRQVPGLRREEVASLAGVSVDYYKRLERGNASGVSEGVLEALAAALRLDDAERAHLFDLARAANPAPTHRPRRAPAQRVRPAVLRILETIGSPAVVRSAHADYLAANPLGRALYAPLFDSAERPPNAARFTFLDPAATCAPRPHATPMTSSCTTSSASCRPAASRSGPGGRRTTSASTRPGPSG